jgi:hypothetical protein
MSMSARGRGCAESDNQNERPGVQLGVSIFENNEMWGARLRPKANPLRAIPRMPTSGHSDCRCSSFIAIPASNLLLWRSQNFLRFLEALEKDRGIGIATRVLAIPLKRANSRVREYLTREGVRITQCDHAIEKLVNYMVMNAASGA